MTNVTGLCDQVVAKIHVVGVESTVQHRDNDARARIPQGVPHICSDDRHTVGQATGAADIQIDLEDTRVPLKSREAHLRFHAPG